MTQIHRCLTVPMPVDVTFGYLADFYRLPEWLYGMQSIQSVNHIPAGLGARFEAALKLGVTLRSTIEITGYEQNSLLFTESVSGITNRSSWRFRALEDKLTEIDITLDYRFPGGLAGRAMAKAVEPFIEIAITSSENTLRNNLQTHYQAKTGQQ